MRDPSPASRKVRVWCLALALSLVLSWPANTRADDRFYEFFSLEMNEVSMFRLQLVGHSEHYLGKSLRISTPAIAFGFDAESPFSGRGFYPSLSFLYAPLFLVRVAAADNPGLYWAWVPLTLLGSTYHYAPGGAYNVSRTQDRGFTGSLFVKNHVDPFVFNRERWIKFSPGAGLGLLMVELGRIPLAFDLSLGYVHSVESDFKGRWADDPGLYFKFSIAGR